MRISSNVALVAALALWGTGALAQQPPPPLPPPGPTPPMAAAPPATAAPPAPPPAAYPPGYPPPGYAPPAYPYPPYGYPPPGWAPPPDTVEDDGQPAPPGYRRVSRIRKGPVISGAIVLGIPYSISLTAATNSPDANDRLLLLPVVGPLFDLLARNGCSKRYGDCSAAQTLLTFDFLMQATGATLLIVGLAAPSHLYVRDPSVASARWGIAPRTFPGGGYGLGLGGEL